MTSAEKKAPTEAVLLLGSGYGALKIAKDLVQSGLPTVWVTQAQHFLELPEGIEPFQEWPEDLSFQFRPLYLRVTRHPLLTPLTRARVQTIEKTAAGYRVKVVQDPRYIDYDRCTGCARCMEVCPLQESDRPPLSRTPDYCPSRALELDKRPTSPCRRQCPLGVNAQAYLALTADGRFAEALAVVRQANPLPGVCGLVCHHPCEASCRRAELDQPLAIRAIKRFLFEEESRTGLPVLPTPAPSLNLAVAVIGSGPAGLTAGHYLNQAGFKVTVFEALPQAGGLLRTGINAFRLPRAVLGAEIGALEASGLTIRVGTPVGSVQALLDEGFQAVLLASGTHEDLRLNVPGEKLDGIHHCIRFMGRLALEGPDAMRLEGQVVVVGGGNSAMDAARSALRLGAAEVTVVAIETESQMPAHPHEVAETREEGVIFNLGYAPVAFEGTDRVERMVCRPAHWEITEGGPPRLILDEGEPLTVPVDRAIVAIGQRPHLSRHGLDREIRTGPGGRIVLDERGQTSIPGVFAAGDAVSGPSTVVGAMASGRLAAGRIIEFLTGRPSPLARPAVPRDIGEWSEISEELPRQPRQEGAQRQPKARIKDFELVDLGLTSQQAMAEASRCLQCGGCCECRACEAACEQIGAIDHFRPGRTTEMYTPAVILAAAGELPDRDLVPPDILVPAAEFKGPTDLMSMMMAGTAAAGRAMLRAARLRTKMPRQESTKAPSPGEDRLGFFLCSCNQSLASPTALARLQEFLATVPGLAYRETIVSACHPDGAERIAQAWRKQRLSKVILASCVCCPLEFQCISCNDQRHRARLHLFNRLGLDRHRFEMVNLRDHLRWAQSDDEVLERAREILRGAIIRSRYLAAWPQGRTRIGRRVLILGGTPVGLSCSANLAAQGLKVRLIHRCHIPGMEPEAGSAREVQTIESPPGQTITQIGQAQIEEIRGHLGNFTVVGRVNGRPKHWEADVVCLTDENLLPLALPTGRTGLKKFYRYDFAFFHSPQSGLYRVKPVTLDRVDPADAGAALASEVLTTTAEAFLKDHLLSPVVDPSRCRGCGRCADICPFKAVYLKTGPDGAQMAEVVRHNCVGCGGCVGRCPVTALDMPYFSNRLLKEMVTGVLGEGW